MATIQYEGYVQQGGFRYRTSFLVQGTNRKEVEARALEEARVHDITELQAVGSHNNRHDWEEIFGPSNPGQRFGSDDWGRNSYRKQLADVAFGHNLAKVLIIGISIVLILGFIVVCPTASD